MQKAIRQHILQDRKKLSHLPEEWVEEKLFLPPGLLPRLHPTAEAKAHRRQLCEAILPFGYLSEPQTPSVSQDG